MHYITFMIPKNRRNFIPISKASIYNNIFQIRIFFSTIKTFKTSDMRNQLIIIIISISSFLSTALVSVIDGFIIFTSFY